MPWHSAVVAAQDNPEIGRFVIMLLMGLVGFCAGGSFLAGGCSRGTATVVGVGYWTFWTLITWLALGIP